MDDEISLGELILGVLKFLKKYIILISVFFVIGSTFGFFKEKRKPQTFSSRIVICSDIIKNDRLEEIVEDLEKAAIEGNSTYFTSVLNISEKEASSILKVDCRENDRAEAYGTRPRVLENQFEECVNVEFTVLDKSSFVNIEKGLVNMMNDYPTVVRILESKRKNIERSRKMVVEDIDYLRDQRKKFIESLHSRDGTVDADQFVTESELIYAYDKVTDYTELLDRLVPAYIMKSFSDTKVSAKSYLKNVIIFGVLFSFIGIFIGIFREIKL